MASKILITGLANSGKTSLCKELRDCLVLARDGKRYPFKQMHKNMSDFDSINEFIDEATAAIHKYNEIKGSYPKTIVIDSVSRIFTDIETACNRIHKGFDVWKHVNLQIQQFNEFIRSLDESDISVILIAHAVWDGEAGKYTETCKGNFAKTGGFLSTVDYALYISVSVSGGKRTVQHKNMPLARTLLEELPDKQDAKDFNLQDYIDMIESKATEVSEWTLDT